MGRRMKISVRFIGSALRGLRRRIVRGNDGVGDGDGGAGAEFSLAGGVDLLAGLHALEQGSLVAALGADLDEAFDKSSEIGNEMCRTRAKTIEGVLIKVNACKLLGSDNDPMEFWYSIKEDIRALAVQS